MSDDSPLDRAFDPDAFRRVGYAFVDRLSDHLRAAMAGDGPVMPGDAPAGLFADWPPEFEASGVDDPLALLDRAIRQSTHVHHRRYIGHQVAAPLPLAALADLTAAMLNNGMAILEMGPAATAMERSVIRWLCDRFGYPVDAGGVLTSGGSLGNLTALLTARAHKAPDQSPGDLAILTPSTSHYSVMRAARLLGVHEDGVIAIEVDDRLRVRPDRLGDAHDRASAAGRRPFAVVAAAGCTATGSYDPLAPIADFCEEHDLWLHVDGAHGGAAILSERHRHLVDGVDRADSILLDAHKMMLMPALVTAVLFRDARRNLETFQQRASYLFTRPPDEMWHDLGHRTFECTKRMMAFKLYLALRVHGVEVFGEQIDRTFQLAQTFARLIEADVDFELAVPPEANIVCFRYVGGRGDEDESVDECQARIRGAVVDSGRYYLVQTDIAGRRYLRTTLMNAFTPEAELSDLLHVLRAAARG